MAAHIADQNTWVQSFLDAEKICQCAMSSVLKWERQVEPRLRKSDIHIRSL